jgi:trehalose synthase-fused probable maltokinase
MPNTPQLTPANKSALEAALPAYLRSKRWFRAKGYTITSVDIMQAIPLPGAPDSYVVIAQVNYEESDPHRYVLLLRLGLSNPDDPALLAPLSSTTSAYDATSEPALASGLLSAIRSGLHSHTPGVGSISAWSTPALASLDPGAGASHPTVMGVEQSNTSVRYGTSLILKLFRRLEDGVSPELEIGRFLGEHGFPNTPPLAGAIEYLSPDTPEPQTLAILQGFVPNQGDAWSYTLAAIVPYYDNLNSRPTPDLPRGSHLLDLATAEVPPALQDAIGPYLESARLLGRRTAEMHSALASDPSSPAFAPQPFTPEYQGAIHGSMRALTEEAFRLLRTRLDALPPESRDEASTLLDHQSDVLARFDPLSTHPIDAMRTRCHGDYHLGQVLWTGTDFIIIDFEGEPVRSLQERRLKHSPLKDVAGMLRSFHYAAYSAMFDSVTQHGPREDIHAQADLWQLWVSASYLRAYLDTAAGAPWLPSSPAGLRLLLDAHLLEKAVYELLYEINMRPDWVQIPLKGILQLLE